MVITDMNSSYCLHHRPYRCKVLIVAAIDLQGRAGGFFCDMF